MVKGCVGARAQPGDQAEGQAVLAAGCGRSARDQVVFPNMDAVFHNVFSTSGRNSFDLGQLPFGRHGAVGHADHARGRGGVLQHPREDERHRPGRTERALREGRSRRQLPASRTSQSGHAAGCMEPERQTGSAKGRGGLRRRPRRPSPWNTRVRRRTRTNSGSHTGRTRNKLYAMISGRQDGRSLRARCSRGRRGRCRRRAAPAAPQSGRAGGRRREAGRSGRQRAAAEKVVDGRRAALEKEVKTAAAIPQLNAPLGDGVDARRSSICSTARTGGRRSGARSAALVTDDRILATRGERQALPHPEGALLARAQTTVSPRRR